ncbi:LCP family protein [Thermostaphylospora chromogena]|uniref:Cell envelope-related function transcriptional attenuator common domain-containing protein n=1 Tax=Thermostaphylospora chromogena TaxID=35622 RepID=A0A1H1HTM0_9ACTN|nr:LCP family protein [Thermostaphylospora chromogena]SDR28835.1 cell envelope-related function transcriptional attenuator common domain-containing protein [Thermostaphylospora chromogena]
MGRRSGELGVGAVIGWTVLSALVPGTGHLRAGRRGTGWTLLGIYALLLTGALILVLTADFELLGALTSSAWLTAITVAAVVLGVGWFAAVVHAYVVLRPGGLSTAGQIASGTAAGVVAVAAMLPFALVAQYVTISRQTLDEVFKTPADAQDRTAGSEDPWNGRDRINILLLGGDADDHRPGVRTDSINVVSVDVETGNTVLFSLPRNLENVRFPPGTPMHERFPDGFRLPAGPGGGREDLLFSVWQYADSHPELFGGLENQGAKTLKETVGYTLGLRIDWYALVNMWGFARLIDAIGGVTITVHEDIVFGKYNEGLIKAGRRKLRGADAMWFARSRTNSDDYTRMRRQRCVLAAILEQADPATVLSRFNQVALATRDLLQTDIPRPMLEHLVPLALKVKNARVTSVQFVPPLIHTGYPDWVKIRRITAKALRDSTASRTATAASASPEPADEADENAQNRRGRGTDRNPADRPGRGARNGDPAVAITEGCA